MKRPIVKICGITNITDGLYAAEMGADILGFIFYDKSPRFIEPSAAGDIISLLKDRGFAKLKFAGVFVNSEKSFIQKTISLSGIDVLQFHGDENPEDIEDFTEIKIKAFRVKNKKDVIKSYTYDTDYILMDSYAKENYGGTGKVFNWGLVENFKDKKRLFLSGGLNSSNIVSAIAEVNPAGVDLSSSLEISPGKKDKKKVESFFAALNSISFENN